MCFLVPQSGATPLWIACSIGNTAIVALLIDHGANVNRPIAVSQLEVVSCTVSKLVTTDIIVVFLLASPVRLSLLFHAVSSEHNVCVCLLCCEWVK